jgi:2-polyprenyl-6-methoxyphenol hydroxylase-like FAD-dependent oxidoreductase
VDLFGPALDVAEWTGVLPAVMEARTQTEVVSFQREDGRGVDLDMTRLVAGISHRHVDYRFEDSIRTLDQQPGGVVVTFENAPPGRFDLVIGADGLHSNVRRLVFGDEGRFLRFLGGYLAIFVLPDYVGLGRADDRPQWARPVGRALSRTSDRAGRGRLRLTRRRTRWPGRRRTRPPSSRCWLRACPGVHAIR